MEEAIKDMVLAGIGGNDIRREVLSTIDILSRSLFDIISLILKKKKWIGSNRAHILYQQYLLFNI